MPRRSVSFTLSIGALLKSTHKYSVWPGFQMKFLALASVLKYLEAMNRVIPPEVYLLGSARNGVRFMLLPVSLQQPGRGAHRRESSHPRLPWENNRAMRGWRRNSSSDNGLCTRWKISPK